MAEGVRQGGFKNYQKNIFSPKFLKNRHNTKKSINLEKNIFRKGGWLGEGVWLRGVSLWARCAARVLRNESQKQPVAALDHPILFFNKLKFLNSHFKTLVLNCAKS